MNSIRRRKVVRGDYQPWDESEDRLRRFYQFALDPKDVTNRCEALGFKLIARRNIGSLKGIEDEFGEVKLVDWVKRLPFGGAAKVSVLLDSILGKQVAHSRLLILRKS